MPLPDYTDLLRAAPCRLIADYRFVNVHRVIVARRSREHDSYKVPSDFFRVNRRNRRGEARRGERF